MSPGHHKNNSKPRIKRNHERLSITFLAWVRFSWLLFLLLVINDKPIPARIINIAVEFPTKRFKNFPNAEVYENDPKQKLKFTMNIPKIAYALAISKPATRCVFIEWFILVTCSFWLSHNGSSSKNLNFHPNQPY